MGWGYCAKRGITFLTSGTATPITSIGEGPSITQFMSNLSNFQKNMGFFVADQLTGTIVGNRDLAHDFIDADKHDRTKWYDDYSNRMLLLETQLVILFNCISKVQDPVETLNRLSFYLTESELSSPLFPIIPSADGNPNLDTAYLHLLLPTVSAQDKIDIKLYINTLIFAVYEKGSIPTEYRIKILDDII